MLELARRSVLVTGGAGVIGRWLVDLLLSEGADVFVGDLKPCPPHWVGRLRYRQGDLNTLTCEEMDLIAPQVLIHLAATFERSIETAGFWQENFHHNILLSHHIMSLAKQQASLQRVVFASSYLCYDPANYLRPARSALPLPPPLSEDAAVRPRNLVGMAKLAHEQELTFLEQVGSHNFSQVSARIFRGYGIGSRDYLSRSVRRALRGEPVSAYAVEGEFDYIFCRDSAEGLLHLAREIAFSGVVNLGSGRRRSVSDAFAIIGQHFPAMQIDIQASDLPIESSEADVAVLRKVTGWTPSTSLEEGIAAVVSHEQALWSSLQGRPGAVPTSERRPD